MRGLQILTRTLTGACVTDAHGNRWQYHPQSDNHSKIACWAILFDLLETSGLLREHARAGAVVFGVNHEMRDFKNNKKKDLDLVIARPSSGKSKNRSFAELEPEYRMKLTEEEKAMLKALPPLREGAVGSVLMALEAKACMTKHVSSIPRLHDELSSSHLTIHGAADEAVAVGFVMVNSAREFVSPKRNPWSLKRRKPVVSRHKQSHDVEAVVHALGLMGRRAKTGESGFDALGISVIECMNDGSTVRLIEAPPAPPPGDIYHYEAMIRRVAQLYDTRFRAV